MFLKKKLAYLYPHRFSQITHLSFIYLTEAVLICRNSQAFLPCIYCPICRGYQQGVPSPRHITRLSVRRAGPSIRRSILTYAQPSTATASKTEIASSVSIRRRALVTVEYRTGSREPGGVERKDAARRQTRAREPEH